MTVLWITAGVLIGIVVGVAVMVMILNMPWLWWPRR